MKKILFSFTLTLFLAVYGFSQSNLTQDQIRRHANELGVPFEALQRLVDAYRVQTGLSNPNASGAQVITIREIRFMHESNMLEIGTFYRIRATFWSQSGRSVQIGHADTNGVITDWLTLDTSFLVNHQQNTLVDVLVGVREGQWGGQDLFLVEIVMVN